jgi:choline-sulfatase
MAPSLLLPTEESRLYSTPLVKQAPRSDFEGAVSLEAQMLHGSNLSFSSALPSASANGNGPVTQESTNGNGFSEGLRPEQFITSRTLLEQSKNFASSNAGANGTTKKPNILYIMADQMAAPLLKMNNPDSVIKTPNLDKLAETGVVFSSAYCNSPLCAPSRFTMCSGQLPSKIGGYDNASVLNPDVPTYAHYLRREGYETVLAGKMHFIGPDQLHGFEHRYRPTMRAFVTSLTLQSD